MKKFAFALLAMATALAITPAAMADPITGTIGVDFGAETWTLTSAVNPGITFSSDYTHGIVADATGDFLAAFTPFSTTAAGPGSGVLLFNSPDELFFSVDGTDATFTITGPIDVTEDTGTNLQISGTGILTLVGYDSTNATFNLDATDSSGFFGANSSTLGIDATVTPEPSSLLLLGTGLFGLAFVAFRKAKPARPALNLSL